MTRSLARYGVLERSQFSAGYVSGAAVAVVASIAVVAALVALLVWNPVGRPARTESSLTVYCAAGIRKPVEEIARQYQREYGVAVELQFGNSGGLLAQIEANPSGDLYIPGDDDFVELARSKNLAREALPLAQFNVVLAVAPGNPKEITSLDDLTRPDVHFAIANESAASGRIAMERLRRAGRWDGELRGAARVTQPTVTEVAGAVQAGSVHAGFVFDTVALEMGLDIVELPELDGAHAHVPAIVLTSSRRPAAALRFARYLAAPEKGQPVFEAHHYEPQGIEPWAAQPRITLFSSGLNRITIAETIEEFQEREGVEVNVVVNGCSVLNSKIRAGQIPDAYFACDVSFAADVKEHFAGFHEVSSTRLVLLVRPGNPKGITSLADLAQPGVLVGRADEEKSALGALTRRLLEAEGIYEQVRGNTRVIAPTADFLVNQITAGQQLDAVIVYAANSFPVRGTVEVLDIGHPLALAIQPIGMGKETRYPLIVQRLIEAVNDVPARQRFQARGFTFGVDEQANRLLQQSLK
jgi:molybdate transport system substrate-binding protein